MGTVFLLSLGIFGIKNIELPIEIPFYKKTIKDDFNPEQYRIKGIYGENGSGKTAIMTAVKILTRILLDRNYLNDSVNQRLLVENINKKTRKGSVEALFYAQSDVGPFIYRYKINFEIRIDERVYITGEILERKPGHNSQSQFRPVYEIKNGDLVLFDRDKVFQRCKEKTQNLLEHRSFATFINDFIGIKDQCSEFNWHHLFTLAEFASRIFVVIDGEDDHRNDVSTRLLNGNNQNFLHEAEYLTIYSRASAAEYDQNEILIPRSQAQFAHYMRYVGRLTAFIRIFKADLQNIKVDVKEFGDFYRCRRIMMYDGYELDEEYESRGIRKLIALFDALDAASDGYIVFIDELDSNINDIYLDKLIEYLTYYGKGQLCFTAHNLSPMSVLRHSKCAITFISGANTVHTWTTNGNLNPEHAYRDGFIEDSPFNVDATDFLGVLGGADE